MHDRLSSDPKRRSAVLLVTVLLAAALAGCTAPDEDEPEPTGLFPGNFVKVRYVERFADGTVFNATVPGDLAPNTTLTDTEPGDHEADWWHFWTDVDRYPVGPTILTSVQLVDLVGDGDRDVISQTYHEVAPGQRLSDQRLSLWRFPPSVQRPAELPNPGLLARMEGMEEGDVLTNVTIPPEEGYGPPSEALTRVFPRVDDDRPRLLEDVPLARATSDGNLTSETEEGDVIAYRKDGWVFDARVDRLGESVVDLYLLVESGQEIRFLDAWNATILDVTNSTYDLRHDAVQGQRIREPATGEIGRVTVVNSTAVKVDFNDPRAGRTMVYDVEVVETRKLRSDRDLWSHEKDPVGEGAVVLDVEMVGRHMPTVATTEGTYFNPGGPGGEWFSLSPDLEGRTVLSLQASHAGDRTVYASTEDGSVLRSDDLGRTWSSVAREGLPAAAVDLAPSPRDPAVVSALMDDGRVLRSVDAGATWSETGSAPDGTRGIAAGYNSTDRLWAATDEGVSRSSDGGGTWTQTFDLGVRDVAPFGRGGAYAAGPSSVYVTFDGGDSWELQGSGASLRELDVLPRLPLLLFGSRGPQEAALSQNGGQAWVSVLP